MISRCIGCCLATLQWEVLMPPTKYPGNGEETRWSKTLESVRKDVECFFGILKGRFRILKLPILYSDKEDIENVFFACAYSTTCYTPTTG